MSTNATTWFYAEPETGRPYMITERVTHTFWANRLSGIYLNCIQAEPPYKVIGKWRGLDVRIEWEVNRYFRLTTSKEERGLITVCSEILGFRPTLSYVDANEDHVTEWFPNRDEGKNRLQSIQGNAAYTNIQKNYR